MMTLATDIVAAVIFFFGLVLPLCGWVWIAFCKYVWHFRKGCDNRNFGKK